MALATEPIPPAWYSARHNVTRPVCGFNDNTLEFVSVYKHTTAGSQRSDTANNVDLGTGVGIIQPNTETTPNSKQGAVRRILYVRYTPFTETGFGTVG